MSGVYSGDDVYKPSFFELIAEERLISGLKPAIKHLFVTAARRHDRLNWMVQWSDELFYALIWLLERHYLQEYESSFAENFYGLKRVKYVGDRVVGSAAISTAAAAAAASSASPAAGSGSAATTSTTSSTAAEKLKYLPLSSDDKRTALIYLVLMPYLKARADHLYTRLTSAVTEEGNENLDYIGEDAQRDADQYRHPVLRSLRRLFVQYYPYVHAGYEACTFLYQLRYLFEYSPYYSPFLQLCGQVVRRLSMDDMIAQQKRSNERERQRKIETDFADLAAAWRDRRNLGVFGVLKLVLIRGLRSAADYAKWGILFAIFAFKFLEWWYSPANRAIQPTKLPVPPPPEKQKAAQSGIELPADKSLCPICQQTRVNPAALSSGFVFCYSCIHSYVSSHNRCPVTHRPATLDMVRRIYDNNDT